MMGTFPNFNFHKNTYKKEFLNFALKEIKFILDYGIQQYFPPTIFVEVVHKVPFSI